MKMTKTTIAYGVFVIALLALMIFVRNQTESTQEETVTANSPIDTFAQCISESGATFYGTFWCSHCKAQKELFQNSKKLPYVECSTPDGQNQTKECADKGIEGYPTWIFADGTKASGEQTFEKLSEKTSCPMPNQSE